MIIERTVIVPNSPIPVAKLRKRCMDCENCTGICSDVIQMGLLPEILDGQKEVRL